MTEYPPKVGELLARGAEVTWCPLFDPLSGQCVGAVIIGVAWPLEWDAPRFRTPAGRDVIVAVDGQYVPRRRDSGPAVLPRPGPASLPACPHAP